MNILTIDTSTNACSVAVTSGDRLLAEFLVNVNAHQSTRIIEAVDTVLGSAGMTVEQIDGFGIALGPGSFTGLRVGAATVKGLALATGKPVAGFSSLAMLAVSLPFTAVPVCPMFDARKKEVYTAIYEWHDGPVSQIPDCVTDPATFLDKLQGPVVFVGEGALTYRNLIEDRFGDQAVFAPFNCNQPSAANGAFLARKAFARDEIISLHELAPVYIRLSEAELAKIQKDHV